MARVELTRKIDLGRNGENWGVVTIIALQQRSSRTNFSEIQ
jgi:hypothetical protein